LDRKSKPSATFTNAQVIIIENSHQLPGDGMLDDVKVELFTGNDQGGAA
jgi:hypothetical protein